MERRGIGESGLENQIVTAARIAFAKCWEKEDVLTRCADQKYWEKEDVLTRASETASSPPHLAVIFRQADSGNFIYS